MNTNGAIETFEVERKYAVSGELQLPTAAKFGALGYRMCEPAEHELRATYFDTPDGELAATRLALRHRLGGKDEGWHLKAKSDAGARELLWATAEEMPVGLLQEVAHRLGADVAERLQPIATLRTTRIAVLLINGAGHPVIEIADDRVEAVNELTGRTQRWREWEAELMPDTDDATLDLIEPLLVANGAVRVRGTSKIQRAMSAQTEPTGTA